MKKIAENEDNIFKIPKILVKMADSDVDKNVVIKITMKKPISSSYRNCVSMSIVIVKAKSIPIRVNEYVVARRFGGLFIISVPILNY